jgi:hypothetical protein
VRRSTVLADVELREAARTLAHPGDHGSEAPARFHRRRGFGLTLGPRGIRRLHAKKGGHQACGQTGTRSGLLGLDAIIIARSSACGR